MEKVEKVKDGVWDGESPLFGKPWEMKARIATIIAIIVGIVLLVVGMMATERGVGPVAGVKGVHKVCTIKDMQLSYYKDVKEGEEYFGNKNITNITIKTKACGDLIIEDKHLSNIDGVEYLYQHLDNGKTYEFRVVDGKYVNHVNISQ